MFFCLAEGHLDVREVGRVVRDVTPEDALVGGEVVCHDFRVSFEERR